MHYDVCIIGAGPAGLSVLSAIQQPLGIIKHEHQWNHNRGYNKQKSSFEKNKHLSVCVIDPTGGWLTEWRGRFKSLDIDRLRSPAWATPEYFAEGLGLIEYAVQMGRENELHEIDIPKSVIKDLRNGAGTGLYQIPSAALFEDFCDSLVSRLPHTFLSGTAVSVDKNDDGSYNVNFNNVANDSTELVRAGSIVFALGAAGAAYIPPALRQQHSKQPNAMGVDMDMDMDNARALTVVVVGGGLSAAQAALMAVQKGAKRVVHVSRRQIHSRQYDLPFEWMDPRSAWRTAAKKNEKGAKFRTFEFFETPKKEREEWVRNARGGATIPESYLKRLEKAASLHHLERLVDEVATYEEISAGATNKIRLTFMHGACPIEADVVVLATGSTLNVNALPLLRSVATQWGLPLVGPLPDLNKDLQWGDENFIVVGAFAMLEIGPDSGNLTGFRRAASICADKLGAFEPLIHEGGHLSNAYSSLFVDSDSDSSDCSECSPDSVDDNMECEECEACVSNSSTPETLQFDMDEDDLSTSVACDAGYYFNVATSGGKDTSCAECDANNSENVAVARRNVHGCDEAVLVKSCKTSSVAGYSVGLTVGRAIGRPAGDCVGGCMETCIESWIGTAGGPEHTLLYIS
eukprot:GSChrysophyteH2.ASY1.ANO1.218.1 assembled CDS